MLNAWLCSYNVNDSNKRNYNKLYTYRINYNFVNYIYNYT